MGPADDEEPEFDKPLIIFGRDVRKIPCFRDSIINGVGYGIGGGLLVFMFTSKPRLASHCAFGTFTTVTLAYWFVCRYRWAHQKFGRTQIHAAYRKGLVQKEQAKAKEKEVEVVTV